MATLADAGRVVAVRGEKPDDVLAETASGLDREDLLGSVAVGAPELLVKAGIKVDQPAFVVSPTPMGALLYLWGHGHRTARSDDLDE